MKTKLEKMHAFYGVDAEHTCGNCSNFQVWEGYGKRWFKCVRYGVSNAMSTDWAKKWVACGRYNDPIIGDEPPVINRKIDEPVDGQLAMRF